MDWTDIGISVPTEQLEDACAVAQLAARGGIYIEDYSDLLEEAPKIAHVDLIDEELLQKDPVRAIIHIYVNPGENPGEVCEFLLSQMKYAGIDCTLTKNTVREENWATAWKAFYHPTHLGERLVVCPSWEQYMPGSGEEVITLDPGMAFGSGTHHTTRLCCELIEKTLRPGDRVLDMGTGSGILSIAALKLGAKEALGVDIDPVAVRTAKENASQNGFSEDVFNAIAGDMLKDASLTEKLSGGYDLICANIVADIIIALAPVMRRELVSGGRLITSGIISPRAGEVIEALEKEGFRLEENIEREGWNALLMIKE